MKAMVLAAGLGTRLRPLTDDRPKALVEVAGRSLLAITLRRLYSFGIREVVVNVHHFADLVIHHLDEHDAFGMHVEVSREDDALLDTGGGLKKAAQFFLRDGGDEPFVLHNVDVLSTVDLHAMVERHRTTGALATLAVQRRNSSRQLLFDSNGDLCGRRFVREGRSEFAREVAQAEELAFSGIHVISPRLLPMLTETGAFSIINAYVRLASAGERIAAFRSDEYYWRDLGRPESLAAAEQEIAAGKLVLG